MKASRFVPLLVAVLSVCLVACSEDDSSCLTCPPANPALDAAQSFLLTRYDSLGLRDGIDQMEIYSQQVDQYGDTHIRLKQAYCSLPVLKYQLIVHLDAELNVYRISGAVRRMIEVRVTPRHRLAHCIEVAREDLVSRGYVPYLSEPGELVIFEWQNEDYLCWTLAFGTNKGESFWYYVNAFDGEVITVLGRRME